MNLADIPTLPGYISVARASVLLGVSKVSVYYKIYEQDAFRHVFKLPGAVDDARPILLLLEHEVLAVRDAMQAERDAYRVGRSPSSRSQQLNDWNKRVKQWGRDTHWDTGQPGGNIRDNGQPCLALRAAYTAVNPQDVRPE